MDSATDPAQLQYPFQGKLPEPGALLEVAPGIFWLRMPLPFVLDHINLYLLRDGEGWTILDTGLFTKETRGFWEQIFRESLGGMPVRRVIVTHMHPDHIGLAGWLARHWDVDLWMSRTDFYQCKMLASDRPGDMPDEALEFYTRAGFSDEQRDYYRGRFGGFGAMIYSLPAGYRRLQDGDEIDIDGACWQIVVGHGHAPEHLCLYCPDKQLLLSGDQVLPKITSNVSVFPTEPYGNPLREWLDSCARLREVLPDTPLVLPAHNEPFYGLHARLEQLIERHQGALDGLLDVCSTPQRAVDVFPVLFKREIDLGTLMMATGESVAHLNYLVEAGQMQREADADGVLRYQTN